MSENPIEPPTEVTIYIALLNEGTSVWRPAIAQSVGDAAYRLIGPVPQGEAWEWLPGEVVHVERRETGQGLTALFALPRTIK
jgi:hypothetical protein